MDVAGIVEAAPKGPAGRSRGCPHELVRLRLDFARPFASTAIAEFTFTPDGGGTVVTWSMSGENSLLAKALHLFMNMDRMIGGNFEKGLAKMRAIAESTARRE